MIILGIETSCDDTGVAIVEADERRSKRGLTRIFNIKSNIVSSQIKVHQKYGGVVPNLAAREHLKNLEPCLKQAFAEAKVTLEDIDLITTTIGPGLIPCLLIGVNFAKTLAYVWKKPIIGVNHLEGHIAASFGFRPPCCEAGASNFEFPAIALLVSGGHTQLVLMEDFGKYKILGETRDDAAGECFDKVAKLLGLDYPGGPAIAAEATKFKVHSSKFKIALPRPMIDHKNYDFSFSGLKTAVLYKVKDVKKINVPEMCAEVQQAIIDVLIEKTIRAAKEYRAKTVILSGGVAANNELRKQLRDKLQETRDKVNFLVPPKNLCTDNAAMISVAGYFGAKRRPDEYRNESWKNIKADANLRIDQQMR